MSIKTQPLSIPGPAPLSGTLITPDGTANTAVLLNGATGVPHSYYLPFAKWLAENRHIACLIYDYRDFGASAQRHIKTSPVTMSTWGVHDQQAARDALRQRYPNTPLWVIGHSLGGFMLPFQTGLDQIDRVISVASGPAHTSSHPWPFKVNAYLFWYVLGPALCRVFGYAPGHLSGLGQDLPAGVFRQWKRWCTSPDFYQSDPSPDLARPNFQGLTCALKTIGFTDDVMIPDHIVQKLPLFYPQAQHQHMSISPADFGLTAIGHLKAFSQRNAAIWPELIS